MCFLHKRLHLVLREIHNKVENILNLLVEIFMEKFTLSSQVHNKKFLIIHY